MGLWGKIDNHMYNWAADDMIYVSRVIHLALGCANLGVGIVDINIGPTPLDASPGRVGMGLGTVGICASLSCGALCLCSWNHLRNLG